MLRQSAFDDLSYGAQLVYKACFFNDVTEEYLGIVFGLLKNVEQSSIINGRVFALKKTDYFL